MRQLKSTVSIIDRTNSLGLYLKEIGSFKKMSNDEEVFLAYAAKNGDQVAGQKLVERNRLFVVSIAKQYLNKGLPLDELISAGNEGMMKAVKNFDPTRGFKFITFSVKFVRGAILVAIGTQSRMIDLPANRIELLNDVKEAYRALEQELERSPTVDEVSESLGKDREEIIEAFELFGGPLSLDAETTGKRGEDESTKLIAKIPDTFYSSPDDELMKESFNYHVWFAIKATFPDDPNDWVRNKKNRRCRKILELWFGLYGKRSMFAWEITEFLNNNKDPDDSVIKEERVEQLKNWAIEQMQANEQAKSVLKEYL